MWPNYLTEGRRARTGEPLELFSDTKRSSHIYFLCIQLKNKDQLRYLVILLIHGSDDADVDVEVRMQEFGDSLYPSVLLLSDW